ncbi:pilus assembly protein PilO [Clostridium uliginosum]|uniref:Type IV pilus assembly protein PilO n=1 Tax=Clostridium uliginosum TaxID=119641 RepID=A0A1I1PH60_9CLOT|nr:pilus assembly protein PilO [Clostridium uliginosum]SFD09174.1 type IV pilus assembly protein PilO [Clostridium uliginosum]
MKISKKEKIMLSILAIVLVGFIYYEFVYLKQTSKIVQKTDEKNTIEQKYNNTMNTIDALEKRKSDIKILKTKVNNKSALFYPTISQEHLILEIDKLLKSSGLEGGLTFKPITVQEVEKVEKSKENLSESSIQGIVDKYNSVISKDSKNSINDNDKQNVGNNSEKNNSENINESSESKSNDTQNSDNKNSKDDSKKSNKKNIEQVKCELNFKGSYNSLNNFLNAISKYERKIVVNSITISQKSIDEINGIMGLEIYAMPKIGNELEEYLKWNLDNTYGKNVPFGAGAAVGSTKSESNIATSDFMVSVKSITSDLPTVIIGKSNDSLRSTYAYANSNKEEEVEIVLTKNGDKYYYKYKTSNGTYPTQYTGVGIEFIPTSDNIVLQVLSESRVTSNDKSGIKIKIINKTNKLVNLEVSGDDTQSPRVVVDGDGNNISVSNK